MKKLYFNFLPTIILTVFLFSSVSIQAQSDGMSNKRMEQIIKKEASEVKGQPGNWQMIYGQRLVLIITDEKNNRMRIFTPVVAETELKEGQLKKMLEANFHSALDAKYSLYEDYVISAFIHPLKELTDDQFVDAMRQVVTLADTFGTTYSSTDLIFGGDNTEEEDVKKEQRLNKKPGKSRG
jgi:hypothetical protein